VIQARPPGYHAITPWLITRDTGKLIDFMKAAFGATELARLQMDGRVVHAEVRVEDSVIMMFDARPEWPETPSFLRLYVSDADAAFERALGAGATAVTRVAEHAFGDRVGRVRDPLGNLWWIQAHVRDASFAEIEHPTPAQAQAMQDAMSTLDRELASRPRPGR
jgi:PhnB protein